MTTQLNWISVLTNYASEQVFSNMSMNEGHLDCLFMHRLLGPRPGSLILSFRGGDWILAFLTSSNVSWSCCEGKNGKNYCWTITTNKQTKQNNSGFKVLKISFPLYLCLPLCLPNFPIFENHGCPLFHHWTKDGPSWVVKKYQKSSKLLWSVDSHRISRIISVWVHK